MLIVLVGMHGAGKTTLLTRLAKRRDVKVLTPSTTRPPRSSDDKEYDFVGSWSTGRYAWGIHVGSYHYGLRKSELDRAHTALCATVFEPMSVRTLESVRETSDIEIITVGLDTIGDLPEQHRRVASDSTRTMSQSSFNASREAVRNCDVVLSGDENIIYKGVVAVIEIVTSRGGLVTKSQITTLIDAGSLLVGTNGQLVQSASYDLRLGTDIWCQGKFVELHDGSPRFDIPPYSYAIVTAYETAAFPPFVAGRFDVKVSLFLDGIILSNGPQVDPGYKGILFCMLFNASSKARTIMYGSHFATLEFSTTTTRVEGYGQQYQLRERLRTVMAEQAISGPGGVLISTMEREFEDVKAQVRSGKREFVGTVALIVAIVSLPAAFLYYVLYDRLKDAEGRVAAIRAAQTELVESLDMRKSAILRDVDNARKRALEEIQARAEVRPKGQ